MTNNHENSAKVPRRRLGKWFRLLIKVLIVAALLAGAGYYWFGGKKEESLSGTTFSVKKGPLEITVLEGGTIESKDSQELKNEVKGETKIISIVEEGYYVSQADVDKGLVLVELDSKELLERQTERELQYQNSAAAYTDSREQYDIQKNQNDSDIKSAELAAKFARMDLEKFLGEKVTREIIEEMGLQILAADLAETGRQLLEKPAPDASIVEETTLAAPKPTESGTPPASEEQKNAVGDDKPPSPESASEPTPVVAAAPEPPIEEKPVLLPPPKMITIDFSKYANPTLLGDGKAQQDLRTFENDLVMAEEEVGLAQNKLDGTERLFKKEFVTKNDLETDQLTVKSKNIRRESASTSKALYIKYEFPKQAEKLVAEYEESLRKLSRAQKLAVSKIAQAEAKLKSTKAQFDLQKAKRAELQEQLGKCKIRAEKPGLVVYGGGEERYWRQDRIQEGATVYERQVIITIPDTSVMVVSTKVHESYVKKIKKEQRARIRVDAYPEEQLTGVVDKIGVLPDSGNRWMNPDLKVYDTRVVIEGTRDWLRPGMSAEVEIVVAQLEDVVYVPIQAVSMEKEEQVCFVNKLTGTERRVVKTGEFNDSYIEIKEGLKEGEVVLLRAPVKEGEKETESTEEKEPENSKPEKSAGGEKPN